MSINNSCSLGFPQCKLEFSISVEQINQAYRMAERFSPNHAPFGIPMYPYVFEPNQKQDMIRMEMGRNHGDRRVAAVFTIKKVPDRPGALVHVAVFLIDDKLAATIGIDSGFASVFSIDIHQHTEAAKHFRGQLMHMDLGVATGYIVNVPDEPPPEPDFEDF